MPCPICQSPKTALFIAGLTDTYYGTTTEKFDLWACENCEAKFQQPFIAEETVGKYYPSSTYQPYQMSANPVQLSWKHNPQSMYLRELLKKHAPNDRFSLIDVGCGGGGFLMSVKHYFPNAYLAGVDISEASMQNLKAIGVDGFCGSLYDVELPQKFDYITSSQVLEHVNQPYLFQQTLRKLAHDNTIIMIDIPAADSFTARKFGRHWTHWDLPRHSILYTKKTLTHLFRDFNNLEIRRGGSVLAILSSYKLSKGKDVFQPIFPFESLLFRAITQMGKVLRLSFLFDDKLIWIGKIK